MYFDTSLKTSRRECSAISSPRPLSQQFLTSVQIEEIKRAIRELPFVTKLSPVRTHKGHGAVWGVSLTVFGQNFRFVLGTYHSVSTVPYPVQGSQVIITPEKL